MNALHQLVLWFNDPSNWHGANGVPQRVLEHLSFWLWAMFIATAIGVPGGVMLGRSKRSGVFTINLANIGRAIPSFAVIVIGVSWFGLGNVPVIIALALLAVPPIFTFAFTGIRQVDVATVDAARGMGMTEGRVVRSVQVPLAAPLMLNGLRLSSAAVLATAPLAALVGSGGVGRYVVDGFAIRDYPQVGAGVTLVVTLVVINELVFAGLTRLAAGGTRRPRSVKRDAAATS